MITKRNLDLISELFKAGSVTSQTLKNKDYQWAIFSEFCEMYSETAVPVSGDTLVRYVVYLTVQRNCCERTVRNHLSCI